MAVLDSGTAEGKTKLWSYNGLPEHLEQKLTITNLPLRTEDLIFLYFLSGYIRFILKLLFHAQKKKELLCKRREIILTCSTTHVSSELHWLKNPYHSILSGVSVPVLHALVPLTRCYITTALQRCSNDVVFDMWSHSVLQGRQASAKELPKFLMVVGLIQQDYTFLVNFIHMMSSAHLTGLTLPQHEWTAL